MRRRGYLADVTERWIPGAMARRDLFGFGDGTADQRAIRAMKLQRNPNLKPEDLDYVPEESATEFDQEHDAGISEAIDEMRKARAGTPLSAIRARRAGVAPAETDET